MGLLYLPNDYKLIKEVNLQKDIKLAVFINILSLLFVVFLFILGFIYMPFDLLLVIKSKNSYLLFLVSFVLIIIYMNFHEVIHGIFIKYYCGEKANYGFTGLYFFAGNSNAYFDRKSYIIIALAPVIIFGLLFLTLNMILPKDLFWIVYIVQIVNLAGASGDYYIAFLVSKMPKDILVNDSGINMKVYTKS